MAVCYCPCNGERARCVREHRKFCTHLENCLAAGVPFVPLVVESLGDGAMKQLIPSG